MNSTKVSLKLFAVWSEFFESNENMYQFSWAISCFLSPCHQIFRQQRGCALSVMGEGPLYLCVFMGSVCRGFPELVYIHWLECMYLQELYTCDFLHSLVIFISRMCHDVIKKVSIFIRVNAQCEKEISKKVDQFGLWSQKVCNS